jgi:hypothetical protein
MAAAMQDRPESGLPVPECLLIRRVCLAAGHMLILRFSDWAIFALTENARSGLSQHRVGE